MKRNASSRGAKTPRQSIPPQRLDRFYTITLLSLAGLGIVLQAASLGPLRGSLWGFHFYAFIAPAAAAVAWGLLVLAAIALVRNGRSMKPHLGRSRVLTERPVVSAVVLAAACTALFWLFRSNQLLLGDALPLTIDLPTGKEFHPLEPGTMWLQQFLYRSVGGLFRGIGTAEQMVARHAVALGSVIAGFFFALTASAIGRGLVKTTSHDKATAWLVALILLAQGYIELFFGYVENYTFYTLGVGLYLWFSIRYMLGSSPLLLPALVLVLGLTLHLSAAVLLPSFGVLLIWALATPPRRVGALRDVLFAGVVLLAVRHVFSVRHEGYDLLATLVEASGLALTRKAEGAPGYMFSLAHLRDFFNEHFLIGPLGLLFFVPAAGAALLRRVRLGVTDVFFLVLGVTYLGASWLSGESNLGYARNWDLFAPAGVCFTAASLHFLLRHVPRGGKVSRLLSFGLIFSFLHVAPWIWINHREALSLERFSTLPLGRGRTEVTMGNWYLENNRPEEALEWFQRALKVNPNNAAAYGFLSRIWAEQGRYDLACEALGKAVSLRSDKPEFRNNYVLALIELNRYEEAIPHLKWLVENTPENLNYLRLLDNLLTKLGRIGEAREVKAQMLQLIEGLLSASPGDENTLVAAGNLLVELDRLEEGLARFERALSINPESPAALFNRGSLLLRMGREQEARETLSTFLRLYPDHPMAGWAREQMGN